MNTVEALGIVLSIDDSSMDIERVLALCGRDPVHPGQAAYWLLARKISEKVELFLGEPSGTKQHVA